MSAYEETAAVLCKNEPKESGITFATNTTIERAGQVPFHRNWVQRHHVQMVQGLAEGEGRHAPHQQPCHGDDLDGLLASGKTTSELSLNSHSRAI